MFDYIFITCILLCGRDTFMLYFEVTKVILVLLVKKNVCGLIEYPYVLNTGT